MSKRASLPGASELFRRTSNPVFGDGAVTPAVPPAPAPAPEAESVDPAPSDTGGAASGSDSAGSGRGGSDGAAPDGRAGKPADTRSARGLATTNAGRRGSGRQKHDTKITVYLSGDELVAIEQTRLALRASHDLAVDRGRIVREAVAVLLADFEEHGDDSVLVNRLRDGDLDGQEAAN
ncbi:hypothetical protein BJF85_15270 [Saccharomonospora sp. CUA-673]|uniref:hypothetical protein n=1 Tax=Saccharomonospora sp. CUA-673 TaxID=1904969 RepID=UPI0009664F6D|nr:hypothetical protein [Saccharomonospora sp. CUA-673]OLT47545.1 hypothetical protein BJF85_15270 [Saccharomonospora sp. CUA-673]